MDTRTTRTLGLPVPLPSRTVPYLARRTTPSLKGPYFTTVGWEDVGRAGVDLDVCRRHCRFSAKERRVWKDRKGHSGVTGSNCVLGPLRVVDWDRVLSGEGPVTETPSRHADPDNGTSHVGNISSSTVKNPRAQPQKTKNKRFFRRVVTDPFGSRLTVRRLDEWSFHVKDRHDYPGEDPHPRAPGPVLLPAARRRPSLPGSKDGDDT